MINERKNSTFFDFDLDNSDPTFESIVNQLRPESEAYLDRIVIAKGLHVAHLKLILLNLLKADCQDSHPRVAFSRNRDDYYPQKTGKQGLKVRPDILMPIIEALEDCNYIEVKKGTNAGVEANRYISRMWATDELRKLFQPVRYLFPPAPLNYIILRNNKHKIIPYEENENTQRMNNNLILINEVISQHTISLSISEEEYNKIEAASKRKGNIDFAQTKLVRIFKDTFAQEGRFYGGWWEYLPKEYRSLIRIDGEETVFLDFTGTIVNLIYLECELDPPVEDVYTVPSALPGSREFQKLAMQMILNNPNRHRAHQALRGQIYKKKVNNTGLSEYQLLDALVEKHKPIESMLYKNIGLKFHRIESDITEDILLSLTKKGIPVLPIHDGFIVRTKDNDELTTTMTESCKRKYGRAIPFKVD